MSTNTTTRPAKTLPWQVLTLLIAGGLLILCILAYRYFREENDERLLSCIQSNDVDCVETCLNHGASAKTLKLKGKGGFGEGRYTHEVFPLREAAITGNTAIMQKLIDHGADPRASNGRSSLGESLLFELRGDNTSAIQLLLQHGADANSRGDHDATHLTIYSSNSICKAEALTALLDHGADINAVDWYGDSALHCATVDLSYEIVRFLIAHGAKVDKKNKNEETPLLLASGNLAQGESPPENWRYVWKPLPAVERAAKRKSAAQIIQLLLENGADPRLAGLHGNTALHYAVERNNSLTIDLLLSHHVDVNARNDKGETPLSIAQKHGFKDSVKKLLHAGAKK